MKTSDFELISQVNQEDEGYFSWQGCDNENCPRHGLGNTVYDCQGYHSLLSAQADPKLNLYEFKLCCDCLYEHEYGQFPDNRRQ